MLVFEQNNMKQCTKKFLCSLQIICKWLHLNLMVSGFFHFQVIETNLTNNHSAHQEIANRNMPTDQFREEIVKGLLEAKQTHFATRRTPHVLEDVG